MTFEMIFGAMVLALSISLLLLLFAAFRSPGRRLKSLQFSRDDEGAWRLAVETRPPPTEGLWWHWMKRIFGTGRPEK